MRQFNTTGPVDPADHYLIPPLARIDLDEVLGLVRDKKCFVLHAPRQTGKTSALLALRDLLNGGEAGDWRCVYANVEAGQAARENVADAMRAVLSEFALRASLTLGDDSVEGICHAAMDSAGPMGALGLALSRWAAADRTPLVLLIDEIDSLVGDTLLSVLRQVRAGYDRRPAAFPHSIVLCGVRDVRDYRIHSTAENRMVLGGSAFNIKSESLRLGDFSEQEIRTLLAQHTAATGQAFTDGAREMIGARTAGQPWLVNALCYDACFRHKPGRDHSRPITEAAIREAQERLILRRDTHIDELANKLREERVRRVVEPILTGADQQAWSTEDVAYVCDLGLVAQEPDGTPHIANPIYAEVVPRHLNYAVQAGLPQRMAWYVDADGGLDVEGLIAAFQAFFREHSFRAVPRGRPTVAAAGAPAAHRERRRADRAGVRAGSRTDGPADRVAAGQGASAASWWSARSCAGAWSGPSPREWSRPATTWTRCDAEAGHLIVFDRSPERSWEEKIFRRQALPGTGEPVTVWGM